MRAIAFALLCLSGVLAAPAALRAETLADSTPHIAVTGVASEEAAPDRATILFGVVSEKPDAAAASAENARIAQGILAALKAAGIEIKDLQTRNVSLEPLYEDQRDKAGRVTQIQKGYRARNDLAARITPAARAGEIAAKLIEKGANRIEGIEFDFADPQARLDELRKKAVEDARRRAEAYVGAAGIRMGRVLEIRPEGEEEGAPPQPMMRGRMAAEAASAPPVPVEPGVQRLSSRVTIVWALSR